jgi:hypothetical protein
VIVAKESSAVPYEMQTPAGKAALARRDTVAAARDFDLAIERRLEELRSSDPVLCTLRTLRRVALALPAELLSRGWVPVLTGPHDPIRWRPPQS